MDKKEFKIKHSDLKSALNFCYKAIKSKPLVPAMGDFVLKLMNGTTLGVRALNDEIGAYIRVPAEADSDFEFAVNATQLLSLVNSSSGDIKFSYSEEDGKVTVKPSRGKYDLFAQSPKDHPTQDISNESPVGKFDAIDFLHGVSATSPFAENDEHQPWKGFVCLDASKDSSGIVATDGWSLSYRDEVKSDVSSNVQILISKTAADLITSMSGLKTVNVSTTGKFTVYRGGKEIIVQLNSVHKYPNYKGLFPKHSSHVSVSRSEFIEDLGRIINVAPETDHSVKIEFSTEDGLSIKAHDYDFGKQGVEVIECSPTTNGSVVINSKLMLNALRPRKSDDLLIYYMDEKSPLMIKGDDKITTLVMPIFQK